MLLVQYSNIEERKAEKLMPRLTFVKQLNLLKLCREIQAAVLWDVALVLKYKTTNFRLGIICF